MEEASETPFADVESREIFDFSVESAAKLSESLASVTLPPRMRAWAEDDVRALCLTPASRILEAASATIRLLRTIDELLLEPEPMGEAANIDESAPPAAADLDSVFDRLLENATPTVTLEVFCNASALMVPELKQARAHLARSVERRIVADILANGEEVRRKCKQALRRVIELAQTLRPTAAAHAVVDDTQEIEPAASIAVRDTLLDWRDHVRTLAKDEAVASNTTLQLRESLAQLSRHSCYRTFRAPDRMHLEELRMRAARALSAQDDAECHRVNEDARAFAELLTLVNNREALAVHDAELKRACQSELKDLALVAELTPTQAWRCAIDMRDNLRGLRWRAPEFIRFAEEVLSRAYPGDEQARGLIVELYGRLSEVA